MNAKQLAAEFGVRDVVDFAEQGGLVKAVVSQGGMRGELFLQGATVTAWQPAGERPVIFTSPNAIFAPGTAVRGGVPIIFPWFGPKRDEPKAPQHGFVRAAPWQLESVEASRPGEGTLRLGMGEAEATSPFWPAAHRAGYAGRFGDVLALTSAVHDCAGAWAVTICVETGNAADNEVRLASGGEHRMTPRISVDAIK